MSSSRSSNTGSPAIPRHPATTPSAFPWAFAACGSTLLGSILCCSDGFPRRVRFRGHVCRESGRRAATTRVLVGESFWYYDSHHEWHDQKRYDPTLRESRFETVTDARGNFEIECVTRKQVSLLVVSRRRDQVGVWNLDPRGQEDLELALSRCAVVSGVVTSNGAPVRCCVQLLASGAPLAPWMPTGPKGQFRFDMMPPGVYSLEAVDPEQDGPSVLATETVALARGDEAICHLEVPVRASDRSKRPAINLLRRSQRDDDGDSG